MQKKILALAVAAAISAPAFAADGANVTIYGKVDMAIGTTNNGKVGNTQVASQVSKIGFKGAEDLGNGYSAVWQLEQQIDFDASAKNTWASRNTFLGVKGDAMGTVLLGRHDSAYKIATRHQDVFGDQFADNRTIMGGIGANAGGSMDTRPTDELMWLSPNWNGFKVALSYVAGAENASTAAQIKGGLTAASVVYDQGKEGPLYVAIATQSIKYGTIGQFAAAPAGMAAGDTAKATKFGIGYHAEEFKVNVVLEKISGTVAGAVVDPIARTNTTVNGQFNIDENNAVKVAYTKAGNTGGVVNTGATELGLGFDHKMSKATTVYFQYAKISNGTAANYQFGTSASTASTVGVAGAGATSTVGTSPNGMFIGMKHSF